MPVGNEPPALTRKRDRVSHGTIYKNKNSFSPDEFVLKLKHYPSHILSDVPSFCRASLLAMSKYNLKNTVVLVQCNIYDDKSSV